ncbi:hypothetical protein ACK3Z6_15015 [Aeromonas caviae]|uniref:hypothetical protein n=1 Tax=Aeromonas TaxID=642 RepID=UPI0015DC8713|nr:MULTISPECIES: hypothetical protein [Aeromonas]BBS86967.1 hypothetical protein WP7W18E02_18640 [Aeromonas media]HDT6080142.1 hypothetical protein [Aeromonas veronii bv. veronii]
MDAKTCHIVKSMAAVDIPDELWHQLDMKNLLNSLAYDYKKLDQFREIRQQHEERNAFSRFFNSSELTDAQADATEIQARFARKLGQLMILSVVQSQQLNQQQGVLSDQQAVIHEQTQQLATNDETLKQQQKELNEQNLRLEQLVTEYFELKGLTQEGAIKLIEIAKEIQHSKQDLTQVFDERIARVAQLGSQLDQKISEHQRNSDHAAQQHQHAVDALHQQHHTLQQQMAAQQRAWELQITQLKDEHQQQNVAWQQQWQRLTRTTKACISLVAALSCYAAYLTYVVYVA